MSYIEERLTEAELSGIKAPEDMEARLRRALEAASGSKIKKAGVKTSWKMAAAIIAITLFAAGNQYHALAYYGKTLLGFDGMLADTLSELSNKGKGQSLNEQVGLIDGTTLTINGLMSDENQIIVYYTLNNPSGIQNGGTEQFMPVEIKGFRTKSKYTSGGANTYKDGTEVKGFITFEPVSPLAKKLTLSYWEKTPGKADRRKGEITVPYHPDEAMATRIKQTIDQSIKADSSSINFANITATPTMTIIKGTVEIENQKQLDRALHGVELAANGAPVAMTGSLIERQDDGSLDFTLKYDALPENLQSLQLSLKEFLAYRAVDMSIPLAEIKKPQTLEGQSLQIIKVVAGEKGTEISVETGEQVLLEGVALRTLTGDIAWETTKPETYRTDADGTTFKTVTFGFPTAEAAKELHIKGIIYPEHYSSKVDIPVK